MDTNTQGQSENIQTLFETFVDQITQKLTARGKLTYKSIYNRWNEWCIRGNINPLRLTQPNVERFLTRQQYGYRTRFQQLSTLRVLARVIAQSDPNNEALQKISEDLTAMKVPLNGLSQTQEKYRELKPQQVETVLDVWQENSLLHRRNRAIIALLFMTGMRRSEICTLRRENIDLDEGILYIQHLEKPNQSHTVVLPNSDKVALPRLRAWMALLNPERTVVFPRLTKWQTIGPDEPLTDYHIYRIVLETEKLSGLKFTPRDIRRTFLTDAIESQTPIKDVQAQVGHKTVLTTLRYAKTGNALERRKRLKVPYGNKKNGPK